MESALSLLISFIINLAVVAVFAQHFFSLDCSLETGGPYALITNSTDPAGQGHCGEIGLSGAGDALETALGSSAKYVWAVGLLAAGQASTAAESPCPICRRLAAADA